MRIDENLIRDLTAKRDAAERAVDGMPDGPRKERAFEIILQSLLSAVEVPAGKKRGRKDRKSKAKAPVAAESERAARGPRRASGPQGYVRQLAHEGFFDEPRDLPAIVEQLRVVGHVYRQEELSTPLQRLTQARELRRRRDEREGGRKVWVYERQG